MRGDFVCHFIFPFSLELILCFVFELAFTQGASRGLAESRSRRTENRSTHHGGGNFRHGLQDGKRFLQEATKRELLAGLVFELIFILELVFALAEQTAKNISDGAELIFLLIFIFQFVFVFHFAEGDFIFIFVLVLAFTEQATKNVADGAELIFLLIFVFALVELVFQFQFQLAFLHVRHCPDLLTIDDDVSQLRPVPRKRLVASCGEQV